MIELASLRGRHPLSTPCVPEPPSHQAGLRGFGAFALHGLALSLVAVAGLGWGMRVAVGDAGMNSLLGIAVEATAPAPPAVRLGLPGTSSAQTSRGTLAALFHLPVARSHCVEPTVLQVAASSAGKVESPSHTRCV